MALFSRKGKKNTEAAPAPASFATGTAHVLRNPRITEKATVHSAAGVYVFDVSARATKREIMQAVYAVYKVAPRQVRIAQVPYKQRRNMRSGKRGVKKGGKKAYVYLKKGDTLTIV